MMQTTLLTLVRYRKNNCEKLDIGGQNTAVKSNHFKLLVKR